MFCAGANIQMLAGSSHGHKVNFCKFTNETRNSIEDATAHSGQTWIAAVNGTAAQLDAIEARVAGPVERLLIRGVGHAPHLEAPAIVTEAVAWFVRGLDADAVGP